jgi:hypothetical protein
MERQTLTFTLEGKVMDGIKLETDRESTYMEVPSLKELGMKRHEPGLYISKDGQWIIHRKPHTRNWHISHDISWTPITTIAPLPKDAATLNDARFLLYLMKCYWMEIQEHLVKAEVQCGNCGADIGRRDVLPANSPYWGGGNLGNLFFQSILCDNCSKRSE